jgi:hypothetical protein
MDATMEAILIMLAAYVLFQQGWQRGLRLFNWCKDRYNSYIKSKKSQHHTENTEEE